MDFGVRGPANLDTSKLASIYIIRDGGADTTINWVGVWNDDNLGMCLSKAYRNSVCRVRTSMSGRHILWTTNGKEKDSVELFIKPGHNYYVEISGTTDDSGLVYSNLELVDPLIAETRINSMKENILDSYGLMPIVDNYVYLKNSYKDTVNLIANKKNIYRFVPINSWECVYRDTETSRFCFWGDDMAKYFVEIGGVLYLKPRKQKSQKDFEKYCDEVLIDTHYEGNLFATMKSETKSIESPEGILYSCMNSYEGLNIKDTTEMKSRIYKRVVTIFFYWTDKDGKSEVAALFNYEKGLQKEVHSMKSMEEELLACWKTFRVVSLDSINAEIGKVAQ